MMYSRSTMARMMGQEDIDRILFKRTSTMLFKLITLITPTDLATTVLSKSYFNERIPDRLGFFNSSRTRFGRACISNASKQIVKDWKFEWLSLSMLNFKRILAQQLDNDV